MKSQIAQGLNALVHSALGYKMTSLFVTATQYRVFSPRTLHAMRFDLLRLAARRRRWPVTPPPSDKLHLGCGDRLLPGWVNTDVVNSEVDVDLSGGPLPWPDHSFSAVVSQHVIEHLSLHEELIPLLKELRRVVRPGGEVWLSCPDMEKMCRGYLEDRAKTLLGHRLRRATRDLNMRGAPSQHYVNLVFDQTGEHRNIFDLELLSWALEQAGFRPAERVQEADLLKRFPGFPVRDDDPHTLYVRTTA